MTNTQGTQPRIEDLRPEDVPADAWRAAFRLTGHWTPTQPDGFQYLFTYATNSWYRRRVEEGRS